MLAQVQKCLRDNFSSMSEEEQRVIKVDDLTLAEKLAVDKKLCMADKTNCPAFDNHYYECLRSKFTRAGVVSDAVEPLADEPSCAKLYEAVQASRAHGGNRQLLQQYLQMTEKAPSHTECCGLPAHALELKPHLGGGRMSTLGAFCVYIKKFSLRTLFPLQTIAVLPQLDKALTQAYTFMKNKGYSPEAFWSLYEDKADLVDPAVAV